MKNMKLKLNTSIENFKDAYKAHVEKCNFNIKTLTELMGEEGYEYLANKKVTILTGFFNDGKLEGVAEYNFDTGEYVVTIDTGADEWQEVSVINTEEKALLIISTVASRLRFTGLNK